MARKKPAPADQPRPSKAVRALREALGLEELDWQAYLKHAREGFADYERENWIHPKSTLRLQDVPAKWFEDPEALGFITIRVLTEGEANLAAPVASHFLRICEPEPYSYHGPPGIGLAWLRLARQELEPPVALDRLVYLALHMPKDFFQGVSEDDLLPLSRLILEGREAIEAWDLFALFGAVNRAQISVRAPFRLLNELIAAEWISREVKREFCRGLMACPPEDQKFKERVKSLQTSIDHDPEAIYQFPQMWLELIRLDLRRWIPGLQRYAVRALVENIGEPLRDILAEFFLRPDPDPQCANAVTEGVLDLVRLHADAMEPDEVRSLLRKAIKAGTAIVRQAAYRVGAERFGPAFARPALKDKAGIVRDWATKLLARGAVKSGRKVTVRRRSSPSGE
jgi:hypothetical protein